jgi:hypothetical protein
LRTLTQAGSLDPVQKFGAQLWD